MALNSFRLILFSTLAALILAPLAGRLAIRLGWVDVPGSLPHKQHLREVSLGGGWSLALAISLGVLLFDFRPYSSIWRLLAASVPVFLFGVWDDRRGLSAPQKLLGQGLSALILILLDIHVRLFSDQLAWLNYALTVFWLVGITNAFNFVDSMDGLAVGLGAITAAFFMLVMQESNQPGMSAFGALLVGACIGLYYFNASPSRLFLGDAGSQWLGFVLAALGIIYTPLGLLRSQSWFTPILLLGVPIFDTVLIVYSRLRRGRPWYLASFDHTYHRLVDFGFDTSRAVLAMHIASIVLGCLAFIALAQPPLLANGIFGACLLLGAAAILWMERRWSP